MIPTVRRLLAASAFALAALAALETRALAQDDDPVPHGQSVRPGIALSPAEALARMTVPDGFTVELVAAEPDIVNPVAMAFDERGRIWIAESVEYPRKAAGEGRDRIKILEDTTGDGRADRVTIFAQGLNIPSGLALGHGGVWVANSPDLLFLRDTDGDDVADTREVVVTGFGRDDTHELPNSLTWGPDGWLYGLNGVYNPSRIEHDGEELEFTCAAFRVHPRRRVFELFAEGTSNPWGLAFNDEGSAFVSACVIDHLWHLTETGYYHRQSGAYPPFTWRIDSIVAHRHQRAAYCGLHWFDSDAYPPEYRGRLYMGNLHGNAINVDVLERDGATYRAEGEDDFLVANDAWFMPVAQKTGPDGCLYVLDWYDRYHCYQDAQRDPDGVDRGRGRLYRVRYGDGPRRVAEDLGEAGDARLIELLGAPNDYVARTARRLLAERNDDATNDALEAIVLDENAGTTARLAALWARASASAVETELLVALVADADPLLRAWGVRLAGDRRTTAGAPLEENVRGSFARLARDPDSRVLVELAIAAGKVADAEPIPLWISMAQSAGDDMLVAQIVWENLHPRLASGGGGFVAGLRDTVGAISGRAPSAALLAIIPRAVERLVAATPHDVTSAVRIVTMCAAGTRGLRPAVELSLARIANRVESGELSTETLGALRESLEPILTAGFEVPDRPSAVAEAFSSAALQAARLATSFGDPRGAATVCAIFANPEAPTEDRLAALDALIASGDSELLVLVQTVLAAPDSGSPALVGEVIGALGRLEAPEVASIVLATYPDLGPALRPRVVQLCVQRVPWSIELLEAIGAGTVPPAALGSEQVERLVGRGDAQLSAAIEEHYGALREAPDPEREATIASMRELLRSTTGDALRGEEVYAGVCGQCHTIYGKGAAVGPDLTSNGRSSFEQLLSDVFDPGRVIGLSYQTEIVRTTDGRLLTGLVVEDSSERVVLRIEGGEDEVIPTGEIEVRKTDASSLMPLGFETQLSEQQIADLFAFLLLDRHPSDPNARSLPGALGAESRESFDPAEFGEIVAVVAPGFTTDAVGDDGVALEPEFRGRSAVVRTHPVSPTVPCVLRGSFELPEGRNATLQLVVGHHEKGDWHLVVRAGGEVLLETDVGPQTATDGWMERLVDLSRFAGTEVEIELENQATDWRWEYAYWARVRVAIDGE